MKRVSHFTPRWRYSEGEKEWSRVTCVSKITLCRKCVWIIRKSRKSIKIWLIIHVGMQSTFVSGEKNDFYFFSRIFDRCDEMFRSRGNYFDRRMAELSIKHHQLLPRIPGLAAARNFRRYESRALINNVKVQVILLLTVNTFGAILISVLNNSITFSLTEIITGQVSLTECIISKLTASERFITLDFGS